MTPEKEPPGGIADRKGVGKTQAYKNNNTNQTCKKQAYSFQRTNTAALSNELPQTWFPRAIRHGQSLRIGNLAGDPGSSLWICLRTGAWKDHANGASGGDLVSLYAAMKGIGQWEALKELSGPTPPINPWRAPITQRKESAPDDTKRISFALAIWAQGQEIEGTPASAYLKSRNLICKPDAPLKFHPACPRGKELLPAMLALMVNSLTGEPCGIHRTFIKPDGIGKANLTPNKMMLGRAKDAVIRLAPDNEIMHRLGIVEGIENGLAILNIGWSPVWAALSSGGIAAFSPLPGINELTIFADHDKAGQTAAHICAQRWAQAGKETIIRTPLKPGTDWNDILLETMQ